MENKDLPIGLIDTIIAVSELEEATRTNELALKNIISTLDDTEKAIEQINAQKQQSVTESS